MRAQPAWKDLVQHRSQKDIAERRLEGQDRQNAIKKGGRIRGVRAKIQQHPLHEETVRAGSLVLPGDRAPAGFMVGQSCVPALSPQG